MNETIFCYVFPFFCAALVLVKLTNTVNKPLSPTYVAVKRKRKKNEWKKNCLFTNLEYLY